MSEWCHLSTEFRELSLLSDKRLGLRFDNGINGFTQRSCCFDCVYQ